MSTFPGSVCPLLAIVEDLKSQPPVKGFFVAFSDAGFKPNSI